MEEELTGMQEDTLCGEETEVGEESAEVFEEEYAGGGTEESDPADAAEAAETGGEREPVDYLGQVKELLAGYPELEGKRIPGEVAEACVNGEMTLAQAYGRYQSRLLQRENSRLRTELDTMRQYRENVRRAPVIGTSHAPNPPQRGEDPFLVGFNSED